MNYPSPAEPKAATAAIIKADPNVLRAPFFALQNKNLATIDGYKYKGTRTRNGKTYDFELTVSRNTKTLYPGTLARKAHNAFLSIATERGFPLDGPITWTWRNLCRRMRIAYSGRTIAELKNTIISTALLGVQSREALVSHDGKPISTSTNEIAHLYDRVAFANGRLPDGTKADTNYVWFSDWYLENLNHNYFTYLDFELWLNLDEQSPIASRLYELSLTKFYKSSTLRINYPTLAELLPVKTHKHYSDARRQLDSHFKIAAAAGILEPPRWHRRKDKKIAQLHLYPGKRLIDFKNSNGQTAGLVAEETIENVTVKELRSKPQPPEAKLVSDFYERWQRTQQRGRSETLVELRRPTAKELKQVQGYVAEYGLRKTKALINATIDILAIEWPKAKTFAAVDRYIGQAAKLYNDRQQRTENNRRQVATNKRNRQQSDREKAEFARLERDVGPLFDELPQPERDRYVQRVMQRVYPKVIGSSTEAFTRKSNDVRIRCLSDFEETLTASLLAK